ncbi:hypothetical protein EUGRSUZ_G00094 [Eucalyptus grandis]|uniref:Uncharacterized protein n=2 Tax=Eucalyptus grandis TaxID=71139 RepID=A0ACC3K0K9_EUCGR|nr:hypothetical protein EUGRSUZ_G00094 [Eucalyptus grandis]
MVIELLRNIEAHRKSASGEGRPRPIWLESPSPASGKGLPPPTQPRAALASLSEGNPCPTSPRAALTRRRLLLGNPHQTHASLCQLCHGSQREERRIRKKLKKKLKSKMTKMPYSLG